MARLHFVRRARKARRKHGIRRGDSYFWWKFSYQPMCYSKTRPRPSRLTRSEFLSTWLAAQESVEDAAKQVCNIDGELATEHLVDCMNTASQIVDGLLDECSERADNVEERFPNGCPSLELLRERAERCEELVEQLEAAVSEVEAAETVADVESAVAGIAWEVS